MLKECHHPSKAKIRSIAEFSCKNAKWYKTIVYLILRHLQKIPDRHSKLSVLFIIDAVCRLSRQKFGKSDHFRKRFSSNLADIFTALCKCPSKDKSEIKRTIGLWKEKKFFSSSVLGPIVKKVASFPDSKGSKSTKKRKRRNSEKSETPTDPRKKNKPATNTTTEYNYQMQNQENMLTGKTAVALSPLLIQTRNHINDTGEPARKRVRLSKSPQRQQQKDTRSSKYDSTLGGKYTEEFTAYKPERGSQTVGYAVTENQRGVPDGMVRVMSTTLWLGRKDTAGRDPHNDSVIRQLVEKFGAVHDVSFRDENVFVKYKSRQDASGAHTTLRERLVKSNNQFSVGWGKPPKVRGEEFDFTRGVGLMTLEDLRRSGITCPQFEDEEGLERYSGGRRSERSFSDSRTSRRTPSPRGREYRDRRERRSPREYNRRSPQREYRDRGRDSREYRRSPRRYRDGERSYR